MSGQHSSNSSRLLATISPILRRPSLMSSAKFIFLVMLLVNFRSLPFAWHIRVFLPVLRLRLQYYLLRFRIMFKPKKVRAKILNDWSEALCPIGMNPFELMTVQHDWTTVDDADYNGHLSNSSYAKVLDAARLKLVLKAFPAFARSGGWMALGSTHYHFIREIPFLARYQIRLSIGAWDQKWMFIIARYVTFPKNRHVIDTNSDGAKPSKTPTTSSDFPRVSLRTPAEVSVTPVTPGDASEVDTNLQVEKTVETMKALVAAQSQMTEPDGGVLHCVAISHICFKHGRITVPPGVILPCEGFSKPPSTASDAPFSPTNPPAHWKKVQALRVAPSGSIPAFAKFLKGGWRDVPEGERWWKDALDGPVEEQRKANLKVFDYIRNGMEATRSIR